MASLAVEAQFLVYRHPVHSNLKNTVIIHFEITCILEVHSHTFNDFKKTSFIVWHVVVVFHDHNSKAAHRTLCSTLLSSLQTDEVAALLIDRYRQILLVLRCDSYLQSAAASSIRPYLFWQSKRLAAWNIRIFHLTKWHKCQHMNSTETLMFCLFVEKK